MFTDFLLAVLVFILLTFSACSAIKKVALQPVKVEGIAMEPTLKHGDRIFISRNPDRIERGDIVIFYFSSRSIKELHQARGLSTERSS